MHDTLLAGAYQVLDDPEHGLPMFRGGVMDSSGDFAKTLAMSGRAAFEIHIKPPTASRYGSSHLSSSPFLGLRDTKVRAGVGVAVDNPNLSARVVLR